MEQPTPEQVESAASTLGASSHVAAHEVARQWPALLVLRQRDQQTLSSVVLLVSLVLAIVNLLRGPADLLSLPNVAQMPAEYRPRIGVNYCDWPELCLLPGVSDTLAKRIVANRRLKGPFSQPQDLQRIRGIGPKTCSVLANHLDFSCPAAASGEGDTFWSVPLE